MMHLNAFFSNLELAYDIEEMTVGNGQQINEEIDKDMEGDVRDDSDLTFSQHTGTDDIH